jgi:hypothetical protein
VVGACFVYSFIYHFRVEKKEEEEANSREGWSSSLSPTFPDFSILL